MARAIVTLAEAPEQARQLGQRLREKVLERHPAEQGVSVLLNLFTKLLNP